MIDVKEHIYDDDPAQGHVDVRTCLKDVSYFYIGNGHIQAAIQHAPSGEGTPLGLIFMNPQVLGKKRDSFSFDPDSGYEKTMLSISGDAVATPADVKAGWLVDNSFPAVKAEWSTNKLRIIELFYCPDQNEPYLLRKVELKNTSDSPMKLVVKTGLRDYEIEKEIKIAADQVRTLYVRYSFEAYDSLVEMEFSKDLPLPATARQYWEQTSHIDFHHPLMNRYFNASSYQLPASMSRSAIVDASIWQYNREWVRDHSFMALGLVYGGHHEMAAILINRLLKDFVSPDGDTYDSSEKRDPEDVELDQNGTLLYVLKNYVLWTGDTGILKKHWKKIVKIADYPFKKIFRHEKSGMFYNSREYWERHKIYGIEPGIELPYQVFPAVGLSAAAILARLISKNDVAKRWDSAAAHLKEAILNHPEYSLVDDRGFVKRRGLDGKVQETITPSASSGLPEGVPLAADIEHPLNPDTCAAQPIALGFVPPDSEIAAKTLTHLELLWNQGWEYGGYGRYNMNSEPDSHGAWPFPSLFMARAYLETGDYEKVWRIMDWLNTISGAESCSWFEMYGPRISPPYAQVGITPWTWAEMLTLFTHHLCGIQLEENFIRIRPKLIPGVDNIEGSFPLRGHRLHIDFKSGPGMEETKFKSNVDIIKHDDHELHIPYADMDIYVEGGMANH